ncbi:VPA1269 family protein [uncultured Cohaesibacter sp.]|uniref:VPA1269 family protein n=1 Tax=uncultured Cohaesibacter sp. TaxID=1002546 RepID=UPI0029C7DA27|nr:VPA1269 family protein [uncultured Cohaesibacter sp.]
MKFKILSECAEILSTADERYFFNNSSDEICVHKTDLSADNLLEKIDELEKIIRKGIVDTLSTPLSELMEDPINQLGTRTGNAESRDELTGRIGSDSEKNGSFKYLYLNGLDGPYRDHLISVGKWPFYNGPTKKGYPKRLRLDRHGITANEIINRLSRDEFRTMMTEILIEKRAALSDKTLRGLEFDFDTIRNKLIELNSQRKDRFLTGLSNIDTFVSKQKKPRGINALERAWYCLLFYVAHDFWLLPARKFENAEISKFSWLRIPRFTGQLLDIFVPLNNQEEVRGVMQSIPHLFESDGRQIGIRDLYFIYACSNYASASEFDDAPFHLIRGAIADWSTHHNIAPYVKACIKHYDIQGSRAESIRSKLSVRAGARLASEDAFAIYRLPYNEAKRLLKAQVSTFEKNTKKNFPKQFSIHILTWLDEFENRLGQLNNKSYQSHLTAINHWIRYLFLLGASAPKDWNDVERTKHIHSTNSSTFTIKFYAQENSLDTKFLSKLNQLRDLWEYENQTGRPSPFQQKVDWSTPEKRGRTHRRSIPDLIVETLIEENAKPTAAGQPYAFNRVCLNDSKLGNKIEHMVQDTDGNTIRVEFPLQAAIIDCILYLGMRSSSARWLDSGQGDRLLVDVETEEYHENANATGSRERNGALQLMTLPRRNQPVLSLLMLKNKTMGDHEIPYLPKELAKRLAYIRDLQNKFNPIENKIPAIDQSEKNNLTLANNDLEVFPLFRDPASFEKFPISSAKLHLYWKRLLAHCEPIVHKKRQTIWGEDISFYPFFDVDGSPVWDIHSIRVAVVTSLLEQGVSPTIVQLLVGHKSPIMTLHYEAVDNAKTHTEITGAFEKRRLNAIKKIAELDTPDEIESAISEIFGGLCSPRTNDEVSILDRKNLINDHIEKFGKLQNVPSGFSVFAHGICPGGDCSQGGPRLGSRFTPVHRDKSCSRCRFRITGPAFLAGLTMNANILISEINASSDKVRKLNEEILELENADLPTAILETRVNQESAFRDELWADWGAEYQTIQECLEMERQSGGNSNLPTVSGEGGLDVTFQEQHTVSMLHTICKTSMLISGSSVDIPEGLKERRNEMLYDIMANNNAEAYIIKLNKRDRERAFDAFGDIVQDLEGTSAEGADFIESLVRGDKFLPANKLSELSRPLGLESFLEVSNVTKAE